MKVFLTKQEMEYFNKETNKIINNYGGKKSILTELISIKIYNLIKIDFDLANEYLNKILSLSSFCSDIELSDYNIEDVDILIKFKDNMLSGFIFKKDENSKDVFATVVKICDDLILSMNERFNNNYGTNIEKPSIITNLLSSSNIKYISSLSLASEEELNKKFIEEFKNRVFYNIFVTSKLRKEKFDSIPNKEKENLSKVILNGECSAGEYIYNLCEKSIPKSIEHFIKKTLDEFRKNVNIDITNIDYLYKAVCLCADQLITDLLYSKIQRPHLKDSEFVLIDLIFVNDEIHNINKKQQDIIARKKLIQSKIDKLNSIFDEIKCEISRVYYPSIHKTFSIDHSNAIGVRCCYFTVADRDLIIEGNKYKVKCVYFIRTNGHGFNLDEPLYLEDTLNLSITYRRRVLYSISKETRNELLEAQRDIFSLIDINKDCKHNL